MSYQKIKELERRRLRKDRRTRNTTKKKVRIPSVYAKRRRKK